MKEHILLNWSGRVLRSRRRGERLRRDFFWESHGSIIEEWLDVTV